MGDVAPDHTHVRKSHTDVASLMGTIADVGLLQPIIVRRSGNGYTVIDGNRRLQALQELDISELIVGRDVIIDVDETDADAKFKQIIANVQREDINDIELGHAFIVLKVQYGYQYNEIAEIIGKTQHYVSAKVGLAKRLTPEVQELVVCDWERARQADDNTEVSGPKAYLMNVNVIEDIARLPAEDQKAAYIAIRSGEMDKKEALAYLKLLKEGLTGLEVKIDEGPEAESNVDTILETRIRKVNKDLEQLASTIKLAGTSEREKMIPALETLIEKMNVLYAELKANGQNVGVYGISI